MKVWTLQLQNEWNKDYKLLPIGATVGLVNKTYSGNKDRLGLTATITGIETREIDSGHVAFDKLGYTHEELYIVTYSDDQPNVLWPEEVRLV